MEVTEEKRSSHRDHKVTEDSLGFALIPNPERAKLARMQSVAQRPS